MNNRFQVRDTEEELKKLDEAIKKLGYKDRADWYRDTKRKAIQDAGFLQYVFDKNKSIEAP